MPNPTPFKDLAGYMDKQVIACVEGVITKIQDKIARGTGQYGDWAMQFSTLKDDAGTSHDLVITDENSFLQNGVQGMRFRAEAQPQSKGGPAGVSMGVRFKDGKENRSIKVDNRAKITLLNSAPSQGAPTQGRAVSVQSGGVLDDSPLPPSTATVEERTVDWFRIYDIVRNHAPRGFPDSELKDVTTTIFLSFKAKYSVHADPVFDHPPSSGQPKDQGGAEWPNDDSDQIPFSPAWKSLGSGVF